MDRNTQRGHAVRQKPSDKAKVISISRLGGLQHKYEWQEAAQANFQKANTFNVFLLDSPALSYIFYDYFHHIGSFY